MINCYFYILYYWPKYWMLFFYRLRDFFTFTEVKKFGITDHFLQRKTTSAVEKRRKKLKTEYDICTWWTSKQEEPSLRAEVGAIICWSPFVFFPSARQVWRWAPPDPSDLTSGGRLLAEFLHTARAVSCRCTLLATGLSHLPSPLVPPKLASSLPLTRDPGGVSSHVRWSLDVRIIDWLHPKNAWSGIQLNNISEDRNAIQGKTLQRIKIKKRLNLLDKQTRENERKNRIKEG